MPGASREQAAAIAERILDEPVVHAHPRAVTITMSAGCASLDDDGDDPMSYVEATLLMARRAGGGALVRA